VDTQLPATRVLVDSGFASRRQLRD